MRVQMLWIVAVAGCTSTVDLDGQAVHVTDPVPSTTVVTAAPDVPAEDMACDGEYVVDNTVLGCLDGVDGTRIKVDGTRVLIGPVTLHGERDGDGHLIVMGEHGCATAVLELDVSDCDRLTGHWTATGCGCSEDWPIYAVPAP